MSTDPNEKELELLKHIIYKVRIMCLYESDKGVDRIQVSRIARAIDEELGPSEHLDNWLEELRKTNRERDELLGIKE